MKTNLIAMLLYRNESCEEGRVIMDLAWIHSRDHYKTLNVICYCTEMKAVKRVE